jgi:DNA repair exonuclease SbcCD ATPase subunit
VDEVNGSDKRRDWIATELRVRPPHRMSGELRFPQPERLTLRNFSLYDQQPNITANFGSGVFCLAGANGLGKSTFLAALNFAITGIVANPARDFDSADEYYRHSVTFSSDYFHGRIKDRDAADAEVILVMRVGTKRYEITRGMFDPLALRAIRISFADEPSSVVIDGALMTESERHQAYTQNVTADIGLKSFAQLVFLQHFIFTFDERRRLVFWDEKVAQTALFMTFGVDLDQALHAEEQRRVAEKADSSARNLQWQATGVRSKLKELLAATETPEAGADEDVVSQHQQLLEEREVVLAALKVATTERGDAQVQHADALAQRKAIQEEYQGAFRKRYGGRIPVERHPLVAASLASDQCGLCGTAATDLSAAIRARISGGCPLCGSSLPSASADGPTSEELLALDKRVAERDRALEEAILVFTRTHAKVENVKTELEQVMERLAAFEVANESAMTARPGSDAALQARIAQHQSQIAELMRRKRVALDRRNAARLEFKALSDALARTYAEAEKSFMPLFTELAHEFLGLDLEVALHSQGISPSLVLTVQDTPRRQHQALSESQRYFLDIALRMALARQMAGPGRGACLYIDTPEGSLDIAYESRAGSMFGRFVRLGHQLIMTANINSSQLLLRLAGTCGPQYMRLLRMTDWTSLTEVQSDEEELFNRAYSDIEQRLLAGG